MRSLSYSHAGGAEPLIGVPIASFLDGVATRYPNHEALVSVHQDRRLTYRELVSEVDRLARGLVALGLGHADRIGVWAVNNVEWVLLQFATARIGAILVAINPASRTPELLHALGAARVQALFLMPRFRTSDYVAMAREVRPRLPDLEELVVYAPTGPVDAHDGFTAWTDMLARGDDVAVPTAPLDPDDPINIQFTSGTTGLPKPVLLTHHNILNNGYFTGGALGITEHDRVCVQVPFYHCFGMVISTLGTLTRGGCLVLPSEYFDGDATLRCIERERCTAVHGVPTMFVGMFEADEYGRRDLSSLRTGIMAGAPCPPALMNRVIDEMGVPEILIAYGQTETSPCATMTSPTDSVERRTKTVGAVMPHQELKVIDADGALVPVGTQGEVCFRGYHVMRGYFRMDEATHKVIDEAGWLHSGDLGRMDADGYLAITGRLKDMIIRGGENVYPAEVEAYLLRHPKVAQVAVFGVPDEHYGEEVAAWIQLHRGESATPEEIRAFGKEGLSHFKVPHMIRIVDAFPMTVTGKIQKFRMSEIEEARGDA